MEIEVRGIAATVRFEEGITGEHLASLLRAITPTDHRPWFHAEATDNGIIIGQQSKMPYENLRVRPVGSYDAEILEKTSYDAVILEQHRWGAMRLVGYDSQLVIDYITTVATTLYAAYRGCLLIGFPPKVEIKPVVED